MGSRAPHYFTPEEIRFIKKKIAGRSYAGMTDLFNEHFGLRGKKKLTPEQIHRAASRHKLRNGLDTRFCPGQIPHNKGKKGYAAPGSEKGWFSAGRRPWNYRPVGSERLNRLGYMEVKIRDPKTWKSKHAVIWEKKHGKIPKGSVIIFANGNRLDVRLSNLLMVSRKELVIMNKLGFITGDKELTKAGKSVADIKLLIAERGKE
jgi:hypothetical protein